MLVATEPASAEPQKKASTTQQAGRRASTSKDKKASKGTSSKGTSTKSKTSKGSSTKGKKGSEAASSSKKKRGSTAARKKNSGKAPVETSAEVRRKQQAAQQEIKKTQAEIAANDKAVSVGLADLNRISSEIAVSRKQVADMSAKVKTLDSRIATMRTGIARNQAELTRIRTKYLDAVKKMRMRRGSQSMLAFIFSAENFNQALRRMRWLKQYSEWKDEQSELINKKVKELEYQTKLLAQTQGEQRRALKDRTTAQHNLEVQHAQQDAVVAKLKENGEALRTHLARKQAEANTLRNQVAALIAREQAAAEQRRREQERREQAAREAEEARKAELARQREEQRRQQEMAAAERQKEQAKAKAKAKDEKPKKDKKKNDAELAKNSDKDKNKSGSEYAQARKRRPRNQRDNASAPASSGAGKSGNVPPTKRIESGAKGKPAVGGNFESARGSLPRPVSGAFRVTSQFGRHQLPDLPDVVYDNPGIDAQVAQGAAAQAVFPGRVSGVYVIPGFSTVVIVNHGNYYTIYGNIGSPSVKVGDTVKQGQALGRLAPDPDSPGHSKIHFEVWKNREKLNPLNWIR